MSEQRPLPFVRRSLTSREAARSKEPAAGTELRLVFSFYRASANGATDEECQAALGMNPSTQRPRRVELVRQGWLKDSGRKHLTKAGRFATVWVFDHRPGTFQG